MHLPSRSPALPWLPALPLPLNSPNAYLIHIRFEVVYLVRVAINGFGRIGKLVLRNGISEKGIEWVINHPRGIDSAKYLFKYDSSYGIYPGTVEIAGDMLVIDGKKVKVISTKDTPDKLPWKDLKIDVVIESTGVFRGKDDAGGHLK